MEILKKIIFGIIAFLATSVVASFFVPDQFTVKRAIHIDAPLEDVFQQVNDLRNWDNWNIRHSLDPTWDLQFQHRFIGEGATYFWKGKKETIGSGSLEIIVSKPNEEIVVRTHFNEKNKDELIWYFFKKEDRITHVSFITDFNVGFDPFAKLQGARTRWRTDRSFDQSLKRLKEITEAKVISHQN